ncbi:MAG: hypothetical protein IKQ91_04920 [Oscillospiraceae bacterium]|nr:hypothetical protein [Oscillospiraceae bacterium]
MDDLMLRLSELETQNEETEKLVGRLAAQQEHTEALLKKAIETVKALHRQQQSMIAEQNDLRASVHTVQRHLEQLTERAAGIDETADMLEDRITELRDTTKVLSSDLDSLYEDMNVLSNETRNRTLKLKEDMERFLWDAAESRLDQDKDTMW